MNKKLLKNILISTLPIIAYIIADSIFKKEMISLISAIVISFVEFLISLALYRRIDLFIFFDMILISVMAFISIIFKNPFFFRLKPALIEVILFIYMMPLCFSIKFLSGYLNRYLKGIILDEMKIRLMQKNILFVQLMLLIHISLVIISAIYFSKEVWSFVSGILLYILIALPLLFMFLYRYLLSMRSRKNLRKEKSF
jgi:hypothetical protein